MPRAEVLVSPVFELLGVVQYLSGSRPPGPTTPRRDPWLEERFSRWRGHPAVGLYRDSAAGGGDPHALTAFFLGDPPGLDWARDPALLPGGGRAALPRAEPFLAALRDFARASRFEAFCREARPAWARHAERGRRKLAGLDLLRRIEDYAGERLDAKSFRVVWTLSYAPGDANSYIIPYPYQGPGRPSPGPFEIFTAPSHRDQRDRLPHFAWNEPLYILVERASARHEGLFAQGAQAKRSVVAALARRLSQRVFSRGRALEPAADPAVRRLAALLAGFEDDRARYPTLSGYLPRLSEALRGPAASRRPSP